MSAILFLFAIVAGLIGLGWAFIVVMIGLAPVGNDLSPKLLIPPAVILLAALMMFIVALFL